MKQQGQTTAGTMNTLHSFWFSRDPVENAVKGASVEPPPVNVNDDGATPAKERAPAADKTLGQLAEQVNVRPSREPQPKKRNAESDEKVPERPPIFWPWDTLHKAGLGLTGKPLNDSGLLKTRDGVDVPAGQYFQLERAAGDATTEEQQLALLPYIKGCKPRNPKSDGAGMAYVVFPSAKAKCKAAERFPCQMVFSKSKTKIPNGKTKKAPGVELRWLVGIIVPPDQNETPRWPAALQRAMDHDYKLVPSSTVRRLLWDSRHHHLQDDDHVTNKMDGFGQQRKSPRLNSPVGVMKNGNAPGSSARGSPASPSTSEELNIDKLSSPEAAVFMNAASEIGVTNDAELQEALLRSDFCSGNNANE